jgi:predicted O-methyltransferase YrrM
MYESGDAEYLFSIIRKFKPKKIIEIGSGYSTLILLEALKKNKLEDKQYECVLTCIEPYEKPWLEKLEEDLLREKVEDIDLNFFNILSENDIFFIDSSHVIRPQGDVLFELLQILPSLNKGVLIHIHDIFSPKDYPESWIIKDHRLWNKQYLLEAFLTCNSSFEIIGSLNLLKHQYFKEISKKLPILRKQQHREPAAFWIRKTS